MMYHVVSHWRGFFAGSPNAMMWCERVEIPIISFNNPCLSITIVHTPTHLLTNVLDCTGLFLLRVRLSAAINIIDIFHIYIIYHIYCRCPKIGVSQISQNFGQFLHWKPWLWSPGSWLRRDGSGCWKTSLETHRIGHKSKIACPIDHKKRSDRKGKLLLIEFDFPIFSGVCSNTKLNIWLDCLTVVEVKSAYISICKLPTLKWAKVVPGLQRSQQGWLGQRKSIGKKPRSNKLWWSPTFDKGNHFCVVAVSFFLFFCYFSFACRFVCSLFCCRFCSVCHAFVIFQF